MTKIGLFTPIYFEKSHAKSLKEGALEQSSAYLSPFSKQVAYVLPTSLETIAGVKSQGVALSTDPAKWYSTALKITSYILTLGIAPLIALAIKALCLKNRCYHVQCSDYHRYLFWVKQRVIGQDGIWKKETDDGPPIELFRKRIHCDLDEAKEPLLNTSLSISRMASDEDPVNVSLKTACRFLLLAINGELMRKDAPRDRSEEKSPNNLDPMGRFRTIELRLNEDRDENPSFANPLCSITLYNEDSTNVRLNALQVLREFKPTPDSPMAQFLDKLKEEGAIYDWSYDSGQEPGVVYLGPTPILAQPYLTIKA